MFKTTMCSLAAAIVFATASLASAGPAERAKPAAAARAASGLRPATRERAPRPAQQRRTDKPGRLGVFAAAAKPSASPSGGPSLTAAFDELATVGRQLTAGTPGNVLRREPSIKLDLGKPRIYGRAVNAAGAVVDLSAPAPANTKLTAMFDKFAADFPNASNVEIRLRPDGRAQVNYSHYYGNNQENGVNRTFEEIILNKDGSYSQK